MTCHFAPLVPQRIRLDQVVRSSQRIMAGARQFAVSKFQATSSHAAKGPPLKTFMFPTPLTGGKEALVAAYAQHTRRAVDAVREQFPGLSLDGRLAIVVPDETFMEDHRKAFDDILNEQPPKGAVRLVSAVESSATIPGLGSREIENEERITYAPIGDMDGLERLLVLSVGFDRAASKASSDDVTHGEVRSRLYRAITRAQMMFLIVNEGIKGGWLEYLVHIKVSKRSGA